MKSEKGMNLIVSIFIVCLLIVVGLFGYKFIRSFIAKNKEEDIKTNMISIQSKIKIIKDKNKVSEENQLVGLKLEENTSFNISEELKNILNERAIESTKYYILTQDDLNNNKLQNIKITNDEFYIIDYDTCEVFYSKGNEWGYSLSKMNKEVEQEDMEENNIGLENVETQEEEGE